MSRQRPGLDVAPQAIGGCGQLGPGGGGPAEAAFGAGDGAIARVADGATAFGHRRTKLMVNIAAMDKRVEKRAEYETWAAGLAEALSGGVMTPAYVGFIGEEGEDGVRRAYPPATLNRLAPVRRRYDAENLFHLNLNVAPATLPGQRRRREAQ